MMDNRFGNDGIGTDMNMDNKKSVALGIMGVHVTGLLFAVVGLFVGGYLVWTNAPAAGGEWWPYLRVVATIIGAFLSMKISAVIGYIVGVPVGIALRKAYTSTQE